ncbi:hypothetical protein Droror1_Dr00027544 [Drosera rotundifolia]
MPLRRWCGWCWAVTAWCWGVTGGGSVCAWGGAVVGTGLATGSGIGGCVGAELCESWWCSIRRERDSDGFGVWVIASLRWWFCWGTLATCSVFGAADPDVFGLVLG